VPRRARPRRRRRGGGVPGLGRAAGDLIDLGEIDAGAAGDLAFAFRGDRGAATWVCGNTDRDAAVEFALAIRDAGMRADDYSRHDFVL
jgi:hypothetical protein